MLVLSSFKICTSLDLLSSARVFSSDQSLACLHLLDKTDLKALITSLGLLLTAFSTRETEMSASDATCSPYSTSSNLHFLPEEHPSRTLGTFSNSDFVTAAATGSQFYFRYTFQILTGSRPLSAWM